MKKFFSFVAAAFVSATMFAAAPTTVPTEQDLAKIYTLDGNIVLAVFYDSVPCTESNGIVVTGTYSGWSEVLTSLTRMEALDSFPGWYAVQVPYTDGTDNYLKPIVLQSDGTFDWAGQGGDPNAWTNLGTTNAITLTWENGTESSMKYPNAGAYIYECAYLKNHNNPCVDRVYHNYSISLYAPTFCDAVAGYKDSIVCAGDFDGWGTGNLMNEDVDDDFNTIYKTMFNCYVGGTFKFRLGSGWDNQVQYYNSTEDSWGDCNNIILGDTTNGGVTYVNDSTLIVRYGDEAFYRWTSCGEPTAVDEVAAKENAAIKYFNKGELIILKNGRKYNVLGAEL